MHPTPMEEPPDREVPDNFASAWASVLLDLHEKSLSLTEPTIPPNTAETPCPST